MIKKSRKQKLMAMGAVPALVLAMCGSPKPPLAEWVREAANISQAEVRLVDGKHWYLYWSAYVPQWRINSCMLYLYTNYQYVITDPGYANNAIGPKVCGSGQVPGVGQYVGNYP